jgi:hypothetical protein
MPQPVRDPRPCPHDILIVIGENVNCCERCGAIVTGEDVERDLRDLMNRLIRRQVRP